MKQLHTSTRHFPRISLIAAFALLGGSGSGDDAIASVTTQGTEPNSSFIATTPAASVATSAPIRPTEAGSSLKYVKAEAATDTSTLGANGFNTAQAAVKYDGTVYAEANSGRDIAQPLAAATGSCTLNVSKTFGDACYAVAKATLASGASASYANTRAGYRGSITANCNAGVVTWSAPNCTYIARVPQATANAANAATTSVETRNSYKIGTYYFPGWKNNQLGNARPLPWESIKGYTDREPMLGWYAEDSPGIMTQQLKWMREYGVDYVVFDFLWSRNSQPLLTAGINAYMATSTRSNVEFAIMWANHTDYKFSLSQFRTLFRFWAKTYFLRSDYLKVDGKAVVHLFSADIFNKNAAAIGMTPAALMAVADQISKAEGQGGVSFIGGVGGGSQTFDYSSTSGYAGFSAYNFHSPASIALAPYRPTNVSRSYAELDLSYRNQWDWMLANSSGLFVIPMSSGWDKRPWGGSTDHLHDDSRATPAEFRAHLLAARQKMDEQPARSQRMGVICCWNEFGEGSFIEPTKVDRFQYLEQVRDVFGAN
ncbi:glycoside hydrolase family 99-like domain-containing protein [Paucibacter sp. XJ19-41]|uniref:glycoside hydrolase family 99-like domain-containing protein n=1 Tax=Paucibacter sp. XJ19-41 TaxID=2927824 RepID=UPI00234B8A12|nr:glycoside hydrolase family 99-like domain-containing protein [Paucibacter sp. XJ19-41]MDC6166633.1 glycoside hydrolase family 99-like domain-containing protein [Paucibacter sp. XJ19-41]